DTHRSVTGILACVLHGGFGPGARILLALHLRPVTTRPPGGGGRATQKKSTVAIERDEEARSLWRWLASRFDAGGRLVFVDESGFHISMTRLKARAPRGKRAYGKVPRNRGKNQTLIASMTLQGGMGQAVSIKKGATDAELFENYIEEFLAPTLEAGRVVVLDVLWGRTGRTQG
ncbi:MAG: transposase, partial [Actinomycetota bacterium]|nr:transposase [Actinomycetota bacterium]